MKFFEQIKRWVGDIIEIFLLLIALGVVIAILFGDKAPFVGGIVGNLTDLIYGFGNNGLAGLIALGIVVYLFYRMKGVAVGRTSHPQTDYSHSE